VDVVADETVEVRAERMVAGGLALSRTSEGKVVLVAGALPGERVRVHVERHKGADRGEVVEVLEAAPGRVEPPCPYVAEGCGGCDWQHATPALQQDMRVEIVRDALRRLGRLDDPVVRPGPAIPPEGGRGTLRLGVVEGLLGLRHRSSHEVVPIEHCLVAEPALSALLAPGVVDPGDAVEVVLRVASGTGERLVVAEPTSEGVVAPDDVSVVGGDELDAGKRRWFHTEVAGASLRVSARSFVQARTAGAEALVAVVGEHLEGAPPGPLVDLYGGVGLFAATVGADRPLVVVERSKSAAADARQNLAHRGKQAKVVNRAVARWTPSHAAVVVADPARSGLGPVGVAKVVATGAPRVVLVSCDAAALGRDAAALVGDGYRHVESVVVDMFGHTGHVEVVSRFDRAPD
jgi:23S rRNA (uracil1939-C5)-methyltransferase